MKNGKDDNQSDELRCLDEIIRHIQNVQENCIVLGRRLIEQGDTFVGRQLIHNGFTHDSSKFVGSEWDYMRFGAAKKLNKEERLGLKISIDDHRRSNPHHPDYWGGIQNMPDVYLAEWVCDAAARAAEFGTALREWVDKEATNTYGFEVGDKTHEKIIYYVNLLLNTPFEPVK